MLTTFVTQRDGSPGTTAGGEINEINVCRYLFVSF
jgi:hypothetical protein